jgi:galactokinase
MAWPQSFDDDEDKQRKRQRNEPISLSSLSLDSRKIEDSLLKIGLDKGCLSDKLDLYQMGVEALLNMPSSCEKDAACFWIPGRIEVCGKHTDYAGGKSLLAATTLGFCVVACRLAGTSSICKISTLDQSVPVHERCVEVDLNSRDKFPPSGHWSRYVYVALCRMATDFPGLCGLNIAIGCDLPRASGMSTSSALIW